MTPIALDIPRCQAGADASMTDAAACGQWVWHGYFMTGVPAAMS